MFRGRYRYRERRLKSPTMKLFVPLKEIKVQNKLFSMFKRERKRRNIAEAGEFINVECENCIIRGAARWLTEAGKRGINVNLSK